MKKEFDMDVVKIIKDGESQIIRLPKTYRFKGKKIVISKVGDAIILLPKKNKWKSMIDSLDLFSDDFMSDKRIQ